MARISKIYSSILAVLLSWLGFTCDEWGADEYGTPTATFKAKGVVVSEMDDAPIEGIRAVLKARYSAEHEFGIDTVYTDSKGAFNLKSQRDDFGKVLYVEFSDVDGAENGWFVDKEIEADFTNEKFTGGDNSWYRGEAEKDLGTVQLRVKNEE